MNSALDFAEDFARIHDEIASDYFAAIAAAPQSYLETRRAALALSSAVANMRAALGRVRGASIRFEQELALRDLNRELEACQRWAGEAKARWIAESAEVEATVRKARNRRNAAGLRKQNLKDRLTEKWKRRHGRTSPEALCKEFRHPRFARTLRRHLIKLGLMFER